MAKRPEMIPVLQELAARPDDLGTAIPWDRLTVNEWKPDTCDCVIWQYFDDDNPRVVEFAEIKQVCAEHTSRGGQPDKPLWQVVGREARRKGRVQEIVANLLGSTVSEQLKVSRYAIAWEGAGLERVLRITVKGLTAKQQSDAQAFADAEFGVGTVIVVRG